ncbi:MAG TPA: trigger factor [Cellvibrionaceae bacterium]
MQVSLETTSSLERRLTVGVPADVVDGEVNRRLEDAARSARINGFRKGKVPMSVVRQRYGQGIRQEVLGDVINRSLDDAFRKENLRPAGRPQIEPKQLNAGKDVEFVAVFEVYPTIELQELAGQPVTRYSAEISEKDVDDMIEILRKSQAKWEPVSRPAVTGDRVNIDFVGTQEGVAFDGGSAQGHSLQLGSNSMIPGFEDAIVGMSAGDSKDCALTFPEDYHVESLKGANVNFAITLNTVSAEQLPEVDETFFAAFGINDGGLERFRADVKNNMENEKNKASKNRLKADVFSALLAINPVEVPKSLVLEEIDALRKQALQQYGQLDTSKFDVRALMPDDLFREQAQRRTSLGMLISEIIVKHSIKPDGARVRSLVESFAASYEDPQGVIEYYYATPNLLASVESAAIEDQVVDLLIDSMQVNDVVVPYQELIRPAEQ